MKSVATIVIRDSDIMRVKERKQVADWLRKQARDLTKEGYKYSHVFTARYFWKGDEK